MPRRVPLPMPLRGLAEAKPGSSDEASTTLGPVENVRPRDPDTRQVRMTQRSGMKKWSEDTGPLTNAKVQALALVSVENETVQFTEEVSEVWTKDTDTETAPRNLALDSVGNLYHVDARTLTKTNPDGVELWSVTVPLPSNEHELGALHVSDEGIVLVGVRSGGDPGDARLWAYSQLSETPEVLWELEVGAPVADITTTGGLLFVLTNDESTRRCTLGAWINYTLALPTLQWSQQVPFPGNALARRPDKTVAVVHEPLADRYEDPNRPGVGAALEGWTPDDAEEGDFRVWSWFSASDLNLLDGAEVTFWPDRSGNNRHFFAFLTGGSPAAPTYNPQGIGGQPSVRFEAGQGLRTSENDSTDVENRDRQRTALPGYDGSQFLVLIVARPVADAASPGALLWQPAGATNRGIVVNRDNTGAALEGGVQILEDPASDLAQAPLAQITTTGSFVDAAGQGETLVLSYLCDGNVNPLVSIATRSLLRTQGIPHERWVSTANAFTDATYLGTDGTVGSLDYVGEIAEIIVLERKNLDPTPLEPLIVDHPIYPTIGSQITLQAPFASLADELDVVESSATMLERLEGWAAWKYGAASVFEETETFPGALGPWPHPHGARDDRLGVPTTEETADLNKFLSDDGIVTTWSNNGRLQWAYTTAPGAAATGIGYGLISDSEGNLYSHNPPAVQRVNADGQPGLGAWTQAGGFNLVWRYPRLAVDSFDNVYVPFAATSGVPVPSVRAYKKQFGSIAIQIPQLFTTTGRQTYAVAVPTAEPAYGPSSTVDVAPRLFLAGPKVTNGSLADEDLPHLARYNLVTETVLDIAPRYQQVIGVSNGRLYSVTDAGASELTGGNLDPFPRFVSSATLFGEVFFTDGATYLVYNAADMEVREFKSRSSGALPPRCKLFAPYRGRHVMAAGDDPWQWFMTASGDPYDVDFFPAVRTATQAVSGATSEGAGRMPDKITALVPYSDDVLIVGCDSAIYQFSGDPAAGGAIDVVSETIGMAFGDSWCKDDEERLYFLSNEGDLFVMVPGSKPQAVSRGRVSRALRDIDLDTYQAHVAWNPTERGVHVFLRPLIHIADKDNFPEPVHFWYDPELGFWGNDRMSHPFVIPTSTLQYDGDQAGDRQLLVGCQDGFVRRMEVGAKDDDGFTIESVVRSAPIVVAPDGSMRVQDVTVELDADRDGAKLRLYASKQATRPNGPLYTTDLRPGSNGPRAMRITGSVVWFELYNRAFNQTWAMENASVGVMPMGAKRV